MATLKLDMSESLIQVYIHANNEQKKHVKQVITEVLRLLSNEVKKPVKNHLKSATFKPFNAIQMRGRGVVASEIVIQSRRQ
jgi:hypothetical protein